MKYMGHLEMPLKVQTGAYGCCTAAQRSVKLLLSISLDAVHINVPTNTACTFVIGKKM